ncbi:cysteine desulfurase [Aureococcus anophagefferens]|nr:cysteine desulfurase [Aureococcus anophagefferens]
MAWRLLLLLAAATNAQSASVATDALPPPAAPNALLPPCAPLLAAARRIPVPADAFFMPANLSYLNVGSLGPTPRAAVDCAVERWKELEADKVSRYPGPAGCPRRRALARGRRANVSLDEVALVPSTTVGLTLVADGLASAGYFARDRWGGAAPRVLTTDQEHGGGAGVAPLRNDGPPRRPRRRRARRAARVRGGRRRGLRRGPRRRPGAVVAVSHVLTTTGAALPVRELAALAHERGALFVVDGAQAVGNLDVDVGATGADAYAVSAHKWLLAPTGSGLLYVRRAARPMIAPTYLDEGFSAYTQCTGTTPLQTIAGLGYALASSTPSAARRRCAHNAALYGVTYAALAKLPRVAILSAPPGSGLDSALLSALRPARPTAPSPRPPRDRRQAPDGEGGTPLVANALRVSHHVFNAAADMERFAASLAAEVDARCAGFI